LLEGIRGLLPGSSRSGDKAEASKWGAGATTAEGALIGGATGFFMGGIGAGPGALIGGLTGATAAVIHDGALGAAEQFLKQEQSKSERPADRYARRIENLRSKNESASGAPKAVLQPLSLNLNIDGRTLAQTVSTALTTIYGFAGQAPAADGLSQFVGGDHNFSDN
jgi:hypothetical protein